MSKRAGGMMRVATDIDLKVLGEKAEKIGKGMTHAEFITAPEIQQLALQAQSLGLNKHPLVEYLLSEGYYLQTNRMLHGLDDVFRAIFMSDVAYTAIGQQKKEEKKVVASKAKRN